jgi:hypothetical protein
VSRAARVGVLVILGLMVVALVATSVLPPA